jgi:hypothetical protein
VSAKVPAKLPRREKSLLPHEIWASPTIAAGRRLAIGIKHPDILERQGVYQRA